MSGKESSSLHTSRLRFSDFSALQKIGSGKYDTVAPLLTIADFRDCVVYRALWSNRSHPRTVVLKAYDRKSTSTAKVRAIKREARMMDFVNRER